MSGEETLPGFEKPKPFFDRITDDDPNTWLLDIMGIKAGDESTLVARDHSFVGEVIRPAWVQTTNGQITLFGFVCKRVDRLDTDETIFVPLEGVAYVSST